MRSLQSDGNTNRVDVESVQNLVRDIVTVLTKSEGSNEILTAKALPKGLFVEDPSLVVSEYVSYLQEHPDIELRSIIDNFEQNSYTSVYQLYHDIKIAGSCLIVKTQVGSPRYNDIDFTYKFATELILRESSRLSIQLESIKKDSQDNDYEYSELESQLFEDYNKTSKDYTYSNGEIVTFLLQTEVPPPPSMSSIYGQQTQSPQKKIQPLFTSLTGKSPLDSRETVVRDPYQISSVVPTMLSTVRQTSNLESVSPAFSRIPPPTSQPTVILKNYFHPNWYTINVPTWLSYRNKVKKPPIVSTLLKSELNQQLRFVSKSDESLRSFAPSVDLRKGTVDSTLKGSVWLQHLGYAELKKIKDDYLKSKTPEVKAEEVKTKTVTDIVDEDSQIREEEPAVKELVDEEENYKEEKINVASLLNWDPQQIELFESIQEDKKVLTSSSGNIQKLISRSIIRLNRMRQERFATSNAQTIVPPSKQEISLYQKITKLLALLTESVPVGKINGGVSKRIPVLKTEYNGVLPGPPPTLAAVPAKPTRYGTTRGPYKKKNKAIS